jgi:hypothetical protein
VVVSFSTDEIIFFVAHFIGLAGLFVVLAATMWSVP